MKKSFAIQVWLLTVMVSLWGIDALANGFRNPPEGATAIGRGGGKIAHIDDASALAVNPANLADIEQTEVALSLTFARSEIEYDSLFGPTAKSDNDVAVLPNLFAAFPVAEGNWVVGLGITTPFGQHTKWKEDSYIAMVAPYHAELSMLNFAPTVATRVHDRVSIGFGVNLYYSELEFRQMLPWGALLASPFPSGRAVATGDGVGFGANAGVTFKATERQHLALVYRTPFDVDYEGDFKVSNIPPPVLGAFVPKSDFESTIKYPSMVVLGYGLKIDEKFRIGVDVEWIEYSRYKELPIDTGINAAFSQDISQDWNDIWTIGVGAEWAIVAPWTLRAGYIYMESPVPTSTVAPTLPDSDRHLVSVGLSYERGVNALDLAYAYSMFDDLKVRDNVDPFFNGDYELSSHLVAVTYRRQL